MIPQADFQFDVFLCHNSKDKPEVIKIHEELEQQGLEPFLDQVDFTSGRNWINELLEIIDNQIKSAAIFFGCNGLGPIQEKEMVRLRQKSFLDDNFRLIPIFLPTATEETIEKIPRWIKEYTWVDLRSGDAQAMEKLIITIKDAAGNRNLPEEQTTSETIEDNPTPHKPKPPIPEDDLSSDKGVDYTRLRDLLKAGEWKEADEETLTVMLKAAGREEKGWLDYDSIEHFPCTDLRTIDQLWVKYSDGRFGFTVQKRIWESVGEDYEKFGDRVGWPKGMFFNKEWLDDYSELTFSLDAPDGHLPCGTSVLPWSYRFFEWFWGCFSSLASRLVKCNI